MYIMYQILFPGGSDNKELACSAEDTSSIPRLGKFPGVESGNTFQYSCLENPMDRGAWWAAVYRAAQNRTILTLSLLPSLHLDMWKKQNGQDYLCYQEVSSN